MKNPMNMDGNNVVVTGAGQGVGASVAELVVELGGKAILVDVKGEELEQVADKLGRDNTDIYVGSVTDPKFIENMVRTAVAKNGAINGLVNNAGIIRTAMIDKMSMEYWNQVVDVNMTGVFICLQAVGRHMRERIKEGDTS